MLRILRRLQMLKNVVVQVSGSLEWLRRALEAVPQALETRSSLRVFAPINTTHYETLWWPRKDHRLSMRKNNIDIFDHVRRNEDRMAIREGCEGIFVEIPEIDLSKLPFWCNDKHDFHPRDNECIFIIQLT